MSTQLLLLEVSFLIRHKDYVKWPFRAEGHLTEDNGVSNLLRSYKIGPALTGHGTTLLSWKNLHCYYCYILCFILFRCGLYFPKATEKNVWLLDQKEDA